jgi:hypothetical protein
MVLELDWSWMLREDYSIVLAQELADGTVRAGRMSVVFS